METVFGKIHPANIMNLVWPEECKCITKEAFHFSTACEYFWSHLLGLTQKRPVPNTGIGSKTSTLLMQKKEVAT